MFARLRFLSMAVLSIFGAVGSVWAQSVPLLGAPRVDEQIQVRVEQKKLRYAFDGKDAYFDLDTDHLFLASRPVKVTYPRLNPLRLQMSAQVSEVADPAHALVSTLLETLTGIPGVLRPSGSAAGMRASAFLEATDTDACKEQVATATELYTTLNAALYSELTTPANIGKEINAWTAAVDAAFDAGQSGGAAIRAGIAAISRYRIGTDGVDGLGKKLEDAAKALDAVNRGATGPEGQCAAATRVYEALRLSNADARFQELRRINKTLVELAKLLQDDYTADTKWLNRTYYIVHDQLNPKADKIQKLAIKASTISISVDDSSNVSIKKEEVASASLMLRHFTRFAPEVGAGVTLAFVKRTKYGTSTNADGKTVVGVASLEDVAVDPSVMLNFVCRCATGPFVQPMLQIGATVSKDTPGFLIGGGLRLFAVGKGDVAIAGGGVVAWVKKLKTLKEGDVIAGTKDIEADLGFKGLPQLRPYVSLLVKF